MADRDPHLATAGHNILIMDDHSVPGPEVRGGGGAVINMFIFITSSASAPLHRATHYAQMYYSVSDQTWCRVHHRCGPAKVASGQLGTRDMTGLENIIIAANNQFLLLSTEVRLLYFLWLC